MVDVAIVIGVLEEHHDIVRFWTFGAAGSQPLGTERTSLEVPGF